MTELRRVALPTGVTLTVALDGPEDGPAVILLHGFPESHRTWRAIAPLLADRFRLIMPDQRGFGASDQPQDPADYSAETLVADTFALAEALGVTRFALVGHDWGGAIAWPAALRGDPRLERLAIVNAPHPLLFQKSLIENPGQREAAQYIRAFRTPGMEDAIAAMGWDTFFRKSFAPHVDLASIPEADKQHYLADWSRPGAMTAMLNWYRASKMLVPPPGAEAAMPDWVLRPFPHVPVPTLVVWGMQDKALLPVQLDGLDELVDDLTVVRLPEAGHFVPWQDPGAVVAALRPFLESGAEARAAAS